MRDFFFTQQQIEYDEDQFFPSTEDFQLEHQFFPSSDDFKIDFPRTNRRPPKSFLVLEEENGDQANQINNSEGNGNDDEYTEEVEEENDEELEEKPSKIRFHEFMKVVLIPTKEEFKKANCDLWWKRTDFVSFQKNAASELRMIAMVQGITVHEAKKILYQPTLADLDPQVTTPKTNLNDNTTVTSQIIQSIVEENKDDPFYDLERHTLVFNKQRSESEDSTTGAEDSTNSTVSNAMSRNQFEEEEKNRLLKLKQQLEADLTLCVPVSDPVPASNNMRVSKYRTTIASAGLLAAMGLFSFAAPIIGFYFLSSQR